MTTARRRLVGKWLESTTAYDAAGNKIRLTTPTGAGGALESLYRYDALGRLAEQTKDPATPGHTVDYTYEGEGAQLTRADKTAGAVLRTTTNVYNLDGTLQSVIATNVGGATLATCNWAAGSTPSSGYDADHNPTASRTLTGSAGCASAATITRAVNMVYDPRGLLSSMVQAVRSPDTGSDVVRTQSFTYRNDGATATATHDSLITTYASSPAGWVESVTDWRTKISTFAYAASGGAVSQNLGSGAASAVRTYTPDAMPASAVWSAQGGAVVRSHTAMAYDISGLQISENVAVLHPTGATGADPGGTATYAYDLAERLTSYQSPYKEPGSYVEPTTTYTLDDGGNVTTENTNAPGPARTASSTYSSGRLSTRATTRYQPSSATDNATYTYTDLGEEKRRATTGATPQTKDSAYDPAGHTAKADDAGATATDVDYAYDGNDTLLSRTESAAGTGGKTRLYFYWGTSEVLAEETDGTGATLVRYLSDGAGALLGQHSYGQLADGRRDAADTTGTWAWLLDDPAGNVATQLGDDGTVLEQAAFDPYGRPEPGGKAKKPGAPGSSLGFQAAQTDPTTGSVILGPRQYDPTTARFTTPDVFAASELDLALGTDELTGNRYLFAAANPVAYYEDGHCALGKEQKIRYVADRRRRVNTYEVFDANGTRSWQSEHYIEKVYKTKKICERTGLLGQAVDYATANDISRAGDPGYSNRLGAAEAWIGRHQSGVLKAEAILAGVAAIPTTGGASLALSLSSTGLSVSSGLNGRCRHQGIATSIAWGSLGTTAGAIARHARREIAGRVIGFVGVASNFLPDSCRTR